MGVERECSIGSTRDDGDWDAAYCGIGLMIMRVERGCSIGSNRNEGEKGCGILRH